MSIILITEHDENIYDLMRRCPSPERKPPRHKTQFKKVVQIADKAKDKNAVRSMGEEPAKNEVAVPTAETEYNKNLKAPPKKNKPKPVPHPKVCTKDHKLPPLPWHVSELPQEEQTGHKVDEKRLKALDGPGVTLTIMNEGDPGAGLIIHRDLDFIKNNVVLTKQIKPKAYKINPTGIEPKYIYKRDFGKFPNYLMQRTKAKADHMLAMKDKSQASSSQPKCRYITKDERDKLLLGLKQNWEELQKEFQSLPVLTDTTAKILRKTNLESRLKQLEDDIELIERHPYIYIYDDGSEEANHK